MRKAPDAPSLLFPARMFLGHERRMCLAGGCLGNMDMGTGNGRKKGLMIHSRRYMLQSKNKPKPISRIFVR